MDNIITNFGYDFLNNPINQNLKINNATKYNIKRYIKLAKENNLPKRQIETSISIMNLCLKNSININLLSELGIDREKIILLAISYQEYLSKEDAILFSLYSSKIDFDTIAKLYNCDVKQIIVKIKYCLEIINNENIKENNLVLSK